MNRGSVSLILTPRQFQRASMRPRFMNRGSGILLDDRGLEGFELQ